VIDDMASEAEIRMTELEAGEARHEKLFSDDEEPVETSIPDVHRVVPPPIDRAAVSGRLGDPREIVALDPEAARRLLEELAAW
jgi:FlaA1/EpsC-like NDP-sugar epimerase